MCAAIESPADPGDLRRRQVSTETSSNMNNENHDSDSEDAKDTVTSSKPRKTYGRTKDGTVFTVPTTHDMVSQLLDPREPKNLSDAIVLAVLAVHILTLYFLPESLKRPVFAVVFLFWRAAYNLGIGILLRLQSNENRLIAWAKDWKLFENPATGKNPRPWLYSLLKRELEIKIPEDYEFEKAPIEYNTWLVFRRLVDLILMCDFVSYCLFAIACGHRPDGEPFYVTIARWFFGWLTIGFNLWVKLDAHRVVKDYAWYWGDFFYLVDQELTFDGVFEMAPHPMYSIGYAGYYGISALAASYSVLFISIAAHAAQLAFLVLVENPHIQKTYDPPTRKSEVPDRPRIYNLLGIQNIDLLRTVDYSTFLINSLVAILALSTPQTTLHQTMFFSLALVLRLWYSIGLGVILTRQSNSKAWTRHFLKVGETPEEGWRQWKGYYHITQSLCYATFIGACWKMYSAPVDWNYGFVLLRHVIGASLIALQIWTAVSIYDSLGEFGWFFGDFFFDQGAKLTYTSIYRFLNNPERVLGTAGLYGAAIITWSRSIFALALVSHILTLGFLHFVEKPHMQKIYGRNLRREAGLTKFIKKSLPPPVVEWQSGVGKIMDETSHFVEDFLDTARPKLAAGVSTIVRDTTALFNKYPARLTLTKLSPDLAGFNPKHYSLTVEGESSGFSALSERASGKEGTAGRFPNELKTMIFEYGAPIRVKWRAPAHHGKKDWIGLYMVADNRSREITELSSLGRWIPAVPGQFQSTIADRGILTWDQPVESSESKGANLVSGEMVFSGDKLWWTQGVFEFRYHHDGNHNVMSISQPFEIHIGRFDYEDIETDHEATVQSAIESALLPVTQNCFDRDPDIAPSTPSEPFGSHLERDGRYSKRLVYAIHQMFGIEFAPAVVTADGNVRNLAWRIHNAKQVLAPYSMSCSRGTTTPAAEKPGSP
ncbi:phosphatidylethanolamine N-methyltransferase [Hypoxylon trugodes]|uniref:phosphatidylethanolamine N-methyltransferase n=1 Tax=Hypoxylon trugodes TaxID=326681 RepID=UPI0021A08682|nr:phosphatidylethanolamine N-methyltransferase [Hypoxylon trugodes]KAI1383129.1 phosphatidylethanolamine N-methyltransferase [Hypoxylon trugodes]